MEMVDYIKSIVKNINLLMWIIGLKYILNNKMVILVILGLFSFEYICDNVFVIMLFDFFEEVLGYL